MTNSNEIEIVEVPLGQRAPLELILEESFEGLYLWHAKRTLREAEEVRAAVSSGEPIGLIIPRTIGRGVGYIFYVAVARSHRGSGVASQLVKDALDRFRAEGALEVFASVEENNLPSERLFAAEGFNRTNLADVSKEHGTWQALNMYRVMVVVPGEILLRRTLP